MKIFATLVSLLKAFLAGLLSVLSNTRLIIFSLMQVVVGIAIYIAIATLSYAYRSELTTWMVGPISSSWDWFISSLVFVVLLILDGVFTYIVLMLVGGFLMEWLAGSILEERKVSLDAKLSFSSLQRTLWRSARHSFFRLLLGSLLLVLTLFSFFVPFLGIFISFALAILVGFDFLELARSLTSEEVRSKIDLFRDHKIVMIVFGGLSTLLLSIPILGIMFLPIITAASAHVIADQAMQ